MPKISRIEAAVPALTTKKRVAAYARVSMESENLLHSLSAQVSYYSNLIQKNPEWIYAGVFADEGITGTSTVNRSEFKRLMEECDAGKIDIILVKSISRFARNTVDTLMNVRHLKEIGVEVRFERENISSLSGDGELMLTILASYAQEESESISRNEKWAIKKGFEKGMPNTSLRSFGYDWDAENKTPVINEGEAAWVRYIYSQYLGGASIKGIAKDLKEKGVKALRGDPLSRSTIRRILSSRMYYGDIILQQYYSPKVHQPRRNQGEVPMYEVGENHEPIISRKDFDEVQKRLTERAKNADNYGCRKTFFAGLVKCGKCGYACNRVRRRRMGIEYSHIECNRRKVKECDLLPIREQELKDIMEDTLGKRDKLERIILFDDHVDFNMEGGRVKTCIREFPKGGRYATCFSYRTSCGECGAGMVRMNCYSGKCWSCASKKSNRDACMNRILKEPELIEAAVWALDSDENYEMQYYCKVKKAVVYRDRIVFHMKEGGEKVWQRR